jgi:hypothetical protein
MWKQEGTPDASAIPAAIVLSSVKTKNAMATGLPAGIDDARA